MFKRTVITIFLINLPATAIAGVSWTKAPEQQELPYCGNGNKEPYALPGDRGPRPCAAPQSRNYVSRHKGIGFDILNLESESCFVPDASFKLLDEIIDQAASEYKATPIPPDDPAAQGLAASEIVSRLMLNTGFSLWIPTETLGDALEYRNSSGEDPRHTFDCDTGSMILLSVAEELGLKASLVEITLSSGAGHNYVRWPTTPDSWVEWDMNMREQCVTPPNTPSYQGNAMSKDEVIGYIYLIRSLLWKRQFKYYEENRDLLQVMRLRPFHPGGFNNFAWSVATKEFSGREDLKEDGVNAAIKAVGIQRDANNLDTMGCMYAYAGDFARAAAAESESVSLAPEVEVYQKRLQNFTSSSPVDCTGSD